VRWWCARPPPCQVQINDGDGYDEVRIRVLVYQDGMAPMRLEGA
jgi:hypothetical protein